MSSVPDWYVEEMIGEVDSLTRQLRRALRTDVWAVCFPYVVCQEFRNDNLHALRLNLDLPATSLSIVVRSPQGTSMGPGGLKTLVTGLVLSQPCDVLCETPIGMPTPSTMER